MTDTIDRPKADAAPEKKKAKAPRPQWRAGTLLAHKRPDKVVKNIDGVPVSLVGVDRGTRESMQHRPLMVPPKELYEARRAAKAATPLDELFMRYDIGDAEYSAGLEFEKLFGLSQWSGISTPALMRIPGGAGPGDVSARVYDARNRCWEMLNLVGGQGSLAAKALWSIIGEGQSLRQFTAAEADRAKKSTTSKKKSPPRDAWKGAVICALQMLAQRGVYFS